jgi:hypothetical protein
MSPGVRIPYSPLGLHMDSQESLEIRVEALWYAGTNNNLLQFHRRMV